jgi:CRP-like cAMP-binding protein
VHDIHELKKYSLFGGLLDDQIEKILPLMEQEEYEAGVEIIAEGSPNDKIYFILEGTVSVAKAGIALTEFGEGEEFGEMEVLEIMPSAATIKTLSAVKVKTISNKALREIYHLDSNIFSMMLMNLARDLSRRLRHMDEMAAHST